MDPAYQIPLPPKDLALLGELTAIMGQIDEEMTALVAILLQVDRDAANVIMGSSKVADNAAIWTNVIRNRSENEDLLWLVEHANSEIGKVSEGRNDFIHAVFENLLMPAPVLYDSRGFGFTQGGFRTIDVEARRVRKKKRRSVTELQSVRDQAARLSCLVAHITHLACGFPADSSAWLERLGPTLPPRVGTVATRKAIAQPAQRPPSEKSLRARRRERRAPEK
jgi:hypothetical protein